MGRRTRAFGSGRVGRQRGRGRAFGCKGVVGVDISVGVIRSEGAVSSERVSVRVSGVGIGLVEHERAGGATFRRWGGSRAKRAFCQE